MSPMGLELAWKATSKLNFFPQLKSIVTTILPGRSPMSNHQNFPKNRNFQKNLKFLKNMKFLLLFKVVLTLAVVAVVVAVAAKSEKTLSSPCKHKSLHLKQNSLALKHKSHWRMWRPSQRPRPVLSVTLLELLQGAGLLPTLRSLRSS